MKEGEKMMEIAQENLVVVPTGFEPVFKDDCDFALYFCELR